MSLRHLTARYVRSVPVFPDSDPSVAAAGAGYRGRTGIGVVLGITTDEVGPGTMRCSIAVRDDPLNPFGIAARTDADLAAVITDVERRFTAETRMIMLEFVSGVGLYDPWALEMFRDFAFALMNGVTLERLVPRGQRAPDDYLDLLKDFARQFLGAHLVQEAPHET